MDFPLQALKCAGSELFLLPSSKFRLPSLKAPNYQTNWNWHLRSTCFTKQQSTTPQSTIFPSFPSKPLLLLPKTSVSMTLATEEAVASSVNSDPALLIQLLKKKYQSLNLIDTRTDLIIPPVAFSPDISLPLKTLENYG